VRYTIVGDVFGEFGKIRSAVEENGGSGLKLVAVAIAKASLEAADKSFAPCNRLKESAESFWVAVGRHICSVGSMNGSIQREVGDKCVTKEKVSEGFGRPLVL
jgi:hypothetical protein